MLKKPASFVLSSSKSSTYPRGYDSGFDSPAALLDDLFEHPAGWSVVVRASCVLQRCSLIRSLDDGDLSDRFRLHIETWLRPGLQAGAVVSVAAGDGIVGQEQWGVEVEHIETAQSQD